MFRSGAIEFVQTRFASITSPATYQFYIATGLHVGLGESVIPPDLTFQISAFSSSIEGNTN